MQDFTFRITVAGINLEHAEDFIKGVLIDAIDSVQRKINMADSESKWDKLRAKRLRIVDMADSIEAV